MFLTVHEQAGHACASHLVKGTWGQKWTLTEVRDYLGHSSVAMTERYAHLSAGQLAALVCNTAQTKESGTAGQLTAKNGPSKSILAVVSTIGDRGAARTRDLLFRNSRR